MVDWETPDYPFQRSTDSKSKIITSCEKSTNHLKFPAPSWVWNQRIKLIKVIEVIKCMALIYRSPSHCLRVVHLGKKFPASGFFLGRKRRQKHMSNVYFSLNFPGNGSLSCLNLGTGRYTHHIGGYWEQGLSLK